MDLTFWIAQVLGAIGAVLNIMCFQCKSSKKLIFLQMCSNIAFAAQFLLLDALTGCVNVIIGVIRNIVVLNREKKWADNYFWPVGFIAAYIIATILTWGPVYSFLPLIGMTTWTLAMWSRNGKNIRKWNLIISSPAWITYNILTRAYAGVATEIITDVSIFISIYRHGWKNLDINE